MGTRVIVAFVIADLLSVVACMKIGASKGLGSMGIAGLLLGPLGVVLVGFVSKPAIGGGPEGDDMSRLAWLRGDGKPWTQRADWLATAGAVAAVVVGAVLYASGPKGTLDGTSVAAEIQSGLQLRLASLGLDGSGITVTCPNAPMQAGKIFDCDMAGYPQALYSHVRVTESDDAGRFTYEGW